MYKIIDFLTKAIVNPTGFAFTGTEAPWEIVMDLTLTRSQINDDFFRAASPSVTKYLPFLPIKDHSRFVSLKEGGTPLIRSKSLGPELGIDLWFKLEPQNPTGSFKDRGSAVDVSVARELGAKAIVLASTGNMAASCACYAAAAKMPCFVFVPEGTPPSKLAQVIAYGGHIVQVKGGYNDCARIAESVSRELDFYLAGDYAFRVEGQKTAAFEICDQLFFHAPDVVVVPVGCGTFLAGIGKGFEEYRQLGFIDNIPKLIGVQAEGSKSVVDAFQAHQSTVKTLKRLDTIASAIAVSCPIDGVKALDAIYKSQGSAIAVSDVDMLQAQCDLASEEGIFVEVSSASAFASIQKIASSESLEGQRVVCVLTGNGLKDPASVLKVALKPPSIHPNVGEFLDLYNQAFFSSENVSFFDPATVMFSEDPSVNEVATALRRHFNSKLSDAHIKNIRDAVARFLMKGKVINFADFQDLVQDAMRTPDGPVNETLVVEDFEIQTGKDKKPTAWVIVRINGALREAKASGVGPVDAVITALMDTTESSVTSQLELTDYQVGIRNRGTNAVVEVELRLSLGGTVSIGNGVSPDIIQASIEAFVKAFNAFEWGR